MHFEPPVRIHRGTLEAVAELIDGVWDDVQAEVEVRARISDRFASTARGMLDAYDAWDSVTDTVQTDTFHGDIRTRRVDGKRDPIHVRKSVVRTLNADICHGENEARDFPTSIRICSAREIPVEDVLPSIVKPTFTRRQWRRSYLLRGLRIDLNRAEESSGSSESSYHSIEFEVVDPMHRKTPKHLGAALLMRCLGLAKSTATTIGAIR